MSENFSNDELDFREMLDDELVEIVNAAPGRYTQRVVEGAKNELKKREDVRARPQGNPQFTPGEAPPPVPLVNAPDGKLFSLGQITLATFLGAPVAGSLLVARNYEALENRGAAWRSLAAGIGATILLAVIGFLLPENTPGTGLSIGSCVAAYMTAKSYQGDTIDRHLNAGGRQGSWGLTVGLGLLCGTILLGLIIAVAVAVEFAAPADLQDAPIVKVRVSQAGEVELDGRRVTPERLRAALVTLKEDDGRVWYYRERTWEPMSAEASKVFEIIVDAGVPIRQSSKPDFSDYIDSEGRSVPSR